MKPQTILALGGLLVAALALVVACSGTFDLAVETTPAVEVTLAALATENARLATQVATLTVPTATPIPSLGRLAYVQGGDVWGKELPGGEPRRLTDDGRNREPRWSPSGQWLAFRKGDHQVWVTRADGGDARPLNEGAAVDSFAWTPAADQLVYVAGTGELRTINTDGTDPVILVSSTPAGRIGRIAWSPDAQWIAYEWREQQPGQPPTYRGIRMVSSDGNVGGEPVLEIGDPLLVGWTGDSVFFLIQEGMSSASLLADGSPLYAIQAGRQPAKLAEFTLAYADFVAAEPGQADRVAVVFGAGREAWTNKRLVVASASTGDRVTLTPSNVAVSSPAWSPDGQSIAYAAAPDPGTNAELQGEAARQVLMQRRIFVVNAQSDPQPRQITDAPAYGDEWPLWSADGSHIIFARLDAEDRASLWVVRAEGGEPLQAVDELTPAPDWFGYYGHINWGTLFDWWRGPPGGEALGTPMPTSPTSIGPCNMPTLPLTATRTYTDAEIGYAFDYPADWHLEAEPGWSVILTSEQAKIDLLPDKPFESKTLDEMVAESRSAGVEILCEERWELAGGVPAVRMQVADELGEHAVLLVVINGRSLSLVGYFDTRTFDAIARTLRPISSTEALP